jgi:predicted metalloprotease with PDZ domain
VVAERDARELRVEARIASGRGESLLFDPESWRFVRDLEVDDGGGSARRTPQAGPIEGCRRERPCRVRYRFLLAEAATALARRRGVFGQENVVLAPASAWLARPARPLAGDSFRLSVATPPGLSFVTGLPSSDGSYEASLADLEEAPYTVFGRFERHPIAVDRGYVDVAVVVGKWSVPANALRAWVDRSANAVASYFGGFPIPRTLVVVLPGRGSQVGYGTTRGGRSASIIVWVGREAPETELARDWVLVHEMIHLGFPNLPREQRWIEEGLATYLEPIVKVRHGLLTEEEMWRSVRENMPRGVAAARGTHGLDGVRSIDGLYWGGALFWFLADLEIRERTGGAKSLADVLTGVVSAGGTIAVSWPLARLLDEGDRAAGVVVLRPLYERMGTAPADVDLERVWRRLGVTLEGGIVRFDDAAPLAAVRRGIAGVSPTPRP